MNLTLSCPLVYSIQMISGTFCDVLNRQQIGFDIADQKRWWGRFGQGVDGLQQCQPNKALCQSMVIQTLYPPGFSIKVTNMPCPHIWCFINDHTGLMVCTQSLHGIFPYSLDSAGRQTGVAIWHVEMSMAFVGPDRDLGKGHGTRTKVICRPDYVT